MPCDEHSKFLDEVRSQVKRARDRLSSSIDFASWMRIPIAPGMQRPVDYLRHANFTVFRGLVLRAASATIMPSVSSSIPWTTISEGERAVARERISPSPRFEDDAA
jgi:hypothetical protein